MSSRLTLRDFLDSGEKLLDVISTDKLGFKDISDVPGGFRVLYIGEPELLFGGNVHKEFPTDFKSLKKFYTSDRDIRVTWIYPRPQDKMSVRFFEELRQKVERYKRITNFEIEFNPLPPLAGSLDGYDTVLNYLRDRFSVVSRNGEIVGGVVWKRNKIKYYLIKAWGLLTNTPTHLINHEKLEGYSDRREFELYLLNNYVQLYAKAGGIPWGVGELHSLNPLRDTLVIGISATRHHDGYYIGVSFAFAYREKEIHSFVSASKYGKEEVDLTIIRTKGLYIPSRVARELVESILKHPLAQNTRNVVILQTPIIHESELKGLSEALTDRRKLWILVHLKESGFTKRLYDLKTADHGAYRGICVLDMDSIEGLKSGHPIKAILVTTGKIKVLKGNEYETRNLYLGTPKPIEIEILPSDMSLKAVHLTAYVSRLIMLLNKLDWEAFTTWPKEPFVLKYARRTAEMLSVLASNKDKDLGISEDELFHKLGKSHKPLGLIM